MGAIGLNPPLRVKVTGFTDTVFVDRRLSRGWAGTSETGSIGRDMK